MNGSRSAAAASFARTHVARPLYPIPRSSPRCFFCRSAISIPSRPQWQDYALRTAFRRPLHVSPRLSKKGYNPHVNLDRFQTDGTRKYVLADLVKLQTYKEAYHDSPIQFILAGVFGIVAFASVGLFALWAYYTVFIKTHKYPETVARHIRRAIWSERKGDMEECIKSYQRAIVTAEMIGMDPLSDEVTGLKIWYAELAENAKLYYKAIAYLEKVRGEMLELIQKREEELGIIGKLKGMKRLIGVAVKLGELYQMDKGMDVEAEKVLEWSVTETLKMADLQSRLKPEEEHPWTAEQFAAVFESMLHHVANCIIAMADGSQDMASFYEKTNRFDYASALYLQAASIFKSPSCHMVTLMNNIGACNIQRPLPASEPMDRATQLDAAKKWLLKAIDIAGAIKKSARTEECDQGCVVALHNIGEIEEQLENWDEAKSKYSEAESMSYSISYVEGYQNASVALQRVREKEAGVYYEKNQQQQKGSDEEDENREAEKRTPGGLPAISFEATRPKERS
ncbi:hypothetical protein Dda_8252 [Drechslerella dactyloides]|uniref:Uncharacterized protein n=1 Tax=Drechslerella dactyloides TaxID=74499 RepID=A0AAD6NI21_DREDA|nr:hypothetical protein Dda_8252 [Drechslerella dactyloides]